MPALRTRETPLEVTTDARAPPTVSIISPTPRAFTFPLTLTQNLTDSPYTTPSQSPFEPDLSPLAISCVTPPVRSLSPPNSSSPAPRRKSSSSLDVERRPKKGDEDYVKRPENAFILFRRKCCEDRQLAQEEMANDGGLKKQRQADLSKAISHQWKALSSEERYYWEQLAKEKKKEHERLYPDYVYRPQRTRDKEGKAKKRSISRSDDGVTFIFPGQRAPHGRSASAPNRPAPYHSIQVPNVYVTPSCPTSPSLLPMISRRSSHPGHPDDVMSNFDYCPDEDRMSRYGGFDNIQSSDLLRSMFNVHPEDPAMLLPTDAMFSPGSSISSGSSSPRSEPFTPTNGTMLSHPFSPRESEGYTPTDMQGHLQRELEQLELSSYDWTNNGSDQTELWSASELILSGDDFDLTSIPPMELGMAKFPQDAASELEEQYIKYHQGDERLLEFDDMMAGRSF